MAYYAYNAAHPAPQPFSTDQGKEEVRTDGVGAYYAYDATHEAVQPINGLAQAMGASAELADEAARALIDRRKPLLVAIEWATEVTDTVWRQATPKSELTLLPLTDADLVGVKQAAFGHALPVVGILTLAPVSLELAERAFSGTPYAFHEGMALAAIGDRQPMPRAFFLYVGKERGPEDGEGGRGLLEETAHALGGKLVHIVALEPRVRRVVRVPIEAALAAQFPASPTTAPRVPGAPPKPVTPDRIDLRRGGGVQGFAVPGGFGVVSDTTLVLGAGVAALAIGVLLRKL